MRIGIDARMLGPQRYGGIGRYLHNLLEHLLAQQEAEYTLLGKENANDFSRNGYRTVPLDVPIYSLREQVLLPMKLKGQSVDLLHSPHYNIPLGVCCPLVVTVHDVTHLRLPSSRKTYWYAQIMLYAVTTSHQPGAHKKERGTARAIRSCPGAMDSSPKRSGSVQENLAWLWVAPSKDRA